MEITPEQFGTAGAIVLGALAIVFRRSKSKREATAGEKSTEWWSAEFERLTEKAVRNALANRNEDIRRILREELERHER